MAETETIKRLLGKHSQNLIAIPLGKSMTDTIVINPANQYSMLVRQHNHNRWAGQVFSYEENGQNDEELQLEISDEISKDSLFSLVKTLLPYLVPDSDE